MERIAFRSPPRRGAVLRIALAALLLGASLAWLRLSLGPPHVLAAERPEFTGLVDAGGHRLFAACMGDGSPTVVLENGYAMAWQNWIVVQQGVAGFARVCAFDRAGTGMSDPAPLLPLTAAEVVADTHALMRSLDEPGPFVLAGFSVGGMIARLYAATYPDEVAGLVMIEATPPEWIDQSLVETAPAQRTRALLRLSGRDPDDPGALDPTAPEEFDFVTSSAQLRCAPVAPAVPAIAIVATSQLPSPGMEGDAFVARWQSLQRTQAAQLGADLVTAQTSDHNVPGKQPELVIAAIRHVVDRVNGVDVDAPFS